MADKERSQRAREEVLIFLADRGALAHSPAAILRGVNREGADFTASEIAEALGFLVSAGHVLDLRAPLGAGITYQASAEGVLLRERSLP